MHFSACESPTGYLLESEVQGRAGGSVPDGRAEVAVPVTLRRGPGLSPVVLGEAGSAGTGTVGKSPAHGPGAQRGPAAASLGAC